MPLSSLSTCVGTWRGCICVSVSIAGGVAVASRVVRRSGRRKYHYLRIFLLLSRVLLNKDSGTVRLANGRPARAGCHTRIAETMPDTA